MNIKRIEDSEFVKLMRIEALRGLEEESKNLLSDSKNLMKIKYDKRKIIQSSRNRDC